MYRGLEVFSSVREVNELELSIAVMVLCRTFHSGAGQITYTIYVPQPYMTLCVQNEVFLTVKMALSWNHMIRLQAV